MCNYGDGVGRVIDLIDMVTVNGLDARVMGASFHNVEEVHELIRAGIHALTLPPNILSLMVEHPGTERAVEEFSAGWRSAYGRDQLFEG